MRIYKMKTMHKCGSYRMGEVLYKQTGGLTDDECKQHMKNYGVFYMYRIEKINNSIFAKNKFTSRFECVKESDTFVQFYIVIEDIIT